MKYLNDTASRKGLKDSGPVYEHHQLAIQYWSPLEDVEELTYRGSKVFTTKDFDKNINTKISKANQAFAMLKLTGLNIKTNIRILDSNVFGVLLYAS